LVQPDDFQFVHSTEEAVFKHNPQAIMMNNPVLFVDLSLLHRTSTKIGSPFQREFRLTQPPCRFRHVSGVLFEQTIEAEVKLVSKVLYLLLRDRSNGSSISLDRASKMASLS
jgi:hypothetical protein